MIESIKHEGRGSDTDRGDAVAAEGPGTDRAGRRRVLKQFAAAAILPAVTFARAAEKIRIGIIGPFSGPFASTGVLFRQGIETFTSINGNAAGGTEIELLYRDTGGANPAVAKRLAEELIVRDKVSMLGGFYLSPEATACAPVVNETKTPSALFVAAAPSIMKLSPWFVRVGDNTLQAALPAAEWSAKQGKKKAYIAVADYAPGYDMQSGFKSRFTALGGAIVGEDRIPLNTVDYAPFAERIAKAGPDVVAMFIPSGAPAIAFVKALISQGIKPTSTPIIGMAEADDPDLRLYDDSVLGVYSSLYYAIDAPGQPNVDFKAALAKKFGPAVVPNYSMVAAYDGMQALYKMAAAQNGKPFDSEVAMKAMDGSQWESPRGPVAIDSVTREMTQNMYIRRVEKRGSGMINAIVQTFDGVKAP